MKIEKLTEASCKELLDNIKDNFKEIKHCYLTHNKNFIPLTNDMDRIKSGYHNIDAHVSSYTNQIELETDGKGSYDFINSKKIYTYFNDLSALEANDKRLWVRLTHDHFHKYVVKRWMTNTSKSVNFQQIIKERFFFEGDSQAARIRNGISRLWWIAHLTVDNNEEDDTKKWRLTKAIFESQDFITSILERSLGMYENVRKGVLEYYVENPKAFGSNKSKTIQKLLKDINNYGGVSLISTLNKEQIKTLINELLDAK